MVVGVLILIHLFALVMYHGVETRFEGGGLRVGFIQMNVFSKIAIVGLAFAFLSHNTGLRWLGVGAGLFLAMIVTSRSSLVAIIFFVLFYHMWLVTVNRVMILFFAGIGILTALEVFSLMFLGTELIYYITNDLLLNDPVRGIEGGLSGRGEAWAYGISRFMDQPILGSGFRTTAILEWSAHNGFINLFVEVGILGGTLLVILFVADSIWRGILSRRAWLERGEDDMSRINRVASAFIMMMLMLWISEPTYLNLGTVWTLAMFLLFAAPYTVTSAKAA